jgi:hypothetical protein
MKNIPSKIYLQVITETGTDNEDINDFNELPKECVTWNEERVFETDIEYYLSDNRQQGTVETESKHYDKCVDIVKNILTHKFSIKARTHVGKKLSEVPELSNIMIALEVIEKYCNK